MQLKIKSGNNAQQQELAESLKRKQASASKVDSQTDIYISATRTYIQAIGGELKVIPKFSDG